MPTLLTKAELDTTFTTKDDYISQIAGLMPTESAIDSAFTNYYSDKGNDSYKSAFSDLLIKMDKAPTNLLNIGIDNSNTNVLNYINKINIDITNAKEQNKVLKNNLGESDTDINGSKELIDNYKYLYNINYLKNFSMISGCILASLFLVKGFKN